MIEEYQDTAYCSNCDEDTLQTIRDSGHERDSSHDSAYCHQCKHRRYGLTGEWELDEDC